MKVPEGKFSRALRKSEASGGATPGEDRGGGGTDRTGPLPFEMAESAKGPPDPSLVLIHEPGGEAAAQIRSIRAKLLGMTEGQPPRVITVTSAVRREGKTTVAVNLAVALSEACSGRVLVVDGECHGPAVHALMNLDPQTGLQNMLSDDLDLGGNVHRTEVEGVDALPSAVLTETNGQEGMLAERCEELVEKLRRHYDFVVVDTPPVLVGSEARVFGKCSDGTLMVIRLERTRREVVRRSVDELKESGASVVGCVLTHRRHHIPDLIYRLIGHTPSRYYRYERDR